MNLFKPSQNISKQLSWLFSIFIIGFSLQALIHIAQNYFSEQLDKKINNAQIQGIIGNELIFHIKKMEQQYYQLSATLKPTTRELIIKHAYKEEEIIKKLVTVFEQGGTFSQELRLNLPDKDSVIEVHHYLPDTKNAFDIASIGILPKVEHIMFEFLNMNKLLGAANQFFIDTIKGLFLKLNR